MRNVTVAAVQMKCSKSVEKNIAHAEELVRQAAAKGAEIVLLPELFWWSHWPSSGSSPGPRISLLPTASWAGSRASTAGPCPGCCATPGGWCWWAAPASWPPSC